MSSAVRLPPPVLAALLCIGAVALLGPLTAGAEAGCAGADTPAHKSSSRQAREATLCLINKQRAKRGIKRLREHRAQRKAAKKHTRTMLARGCFDHVCPGERDLVSRISSTRYLPCGCRWGIAENIAFGYGAKASPRKVVAAWMDSSAHRANILGRSFEHIGIGIKPGAPTGRAAAATYTTTFGYRD